MRHRAGPRDRPGPTGRGRPADRRAGAGGRGPAETGSPPPGQSSGMGRFGGKTMAWRPATGRVVSKVGGDGGGGGDYIHFTDSSSKEQVLQEGNGCWINITQCEPQTSAFLRFGGGSCLQNKIKYILEIHLYHFSDGNNMKPHPILCQLKYHTN